MRYLEEPDSERQQNGGPRAEVGKGTGVMANGCGASVKDDEALKTDSGDGCTTV